MPESEVEFTHKKIGQHPKTGENIFVHSVYIKSRIQRHLIEIENSCMRYETIYIPETFDIENITPDMVLALHS